MAIIRDRDRFGLEYKWIPDHDGSYSRGGGGAGRAVPTSDEHVQRRLSKLIRQRVNQFPPSPQLQVLRFPVGIFFARDRKAGGAADIREEITSSFEYWSKDSGEHFDIFFPGWHFRKGKLQFNLNRFIEYREEIEHRSKWKYSGETDLLILNFDYSLQRKEGRFAFDEAIVLQVEEMIREKRIGSLPALLSIIQDSAKASHERGEHSVVWEMSDKIGFLRGRKSLWDAFKKFFLNDFAQVYDNVQPFGVLDLTPRA